MPRPLVWYYILGHKPCQQSWQRGAVDILCQYVHSSFLVTFDHLFYIWHGALQLKTAAMPRLISLLPSLAMYTETTLRRFKKTVGLPIFHEMPNSVFWPTAQTTFRILGTIRSDGRHISRIVGPVIIVPSSFAPQQFQHLLLIYCTFLNTVLNVSPIINSLVGVRPLTLL